MRAANGVVLITTKEEDQVSQVSFDAYYGIANFPKQLGQTIPNST
jgi:hypothetical protein